MSMVWNLMFWFGVAYLVIAIIWRYFVPALSPKKTRENEPETSSGAKRFFVGSRIFPIIALIFLALPIVAKTTGIFDPTWSDEEKVQLQHFASAMDFYDQASQLASIPTMKPEDWETVKALLEASQGEAEQVTDPVLAKIDDKLPDIFKNDFEDGLRIGIFGLTQHNYGVPKGSHQLAFNANDSLQVGRALLSKWDKWYLPRRNSINQLISEEAPE